MPDAKTTRPKIGRPIEHGDISRPRSVSLTDDELAELKAIGDGSQTQGVRNLMQWYRSLPSDD